MISDEEAERIKIELEDLRRRQEMLEHGMYKLISTVNHTDESMSELLDLFKKTKVVFSFFKFLAKLATPIGYFLGAMVAVFAFVTHNGSVFKFFR